MKQTCRCCRSAEINRAILKRHAGDAAIIPVTGKYQGLFDEILNIDASEK
jgi:hypothetical protein